MKVKFGDVVKDVKSNVDRANNPYEFYVAGDHMDTEDFRIHRRGSFATDDVGPAFVRIFHPGQVLYGSRRTYLKKVCVADFDGICANTTFVLETKDEGVLTQRLLPFLMLSDGFTDWSIKHSKGSTNPYILFSDLANYEFSLPPIDRQRELADLLWAANDLKEAYKKAISATDEMLEAKFREIFGEGGGRSEECGVPTKTLGELFKVSSSKRVYQKQLKDEGVPFYHVAELFSEDRSAKAYISPELFSTLAKEGYVPKPGDILLSTRGTIGRCYVYKASDEFYFQDGMITWLSQQDQNLARDFFVALIGMDDFRNKYLGAANGSTVAYLSIAELKQVPIPLPPMDVQREFVAIAEAAENTKAALKRSLGDLEQVMKGLINQ